MMPQPKMYDVVIVGAGASGIGVGIILKQLGIKQFTLLEKEEIGASFAKWPEEMRLITPSFQGNAFGLLDLNAVALNTSPAYTLDSEHPSGKEYTTYLRAVGEHFQVPVVTDVEVYSVEKHEEGFKLQTSAGKTYSRFVIWAAGAFKYPLQDGFPGAELCVHNSTVRSWKDFEGDSYAVIGGYESGFDAAEQLVKQGKDVTVFAKSNTWG